MVICKLGEPLKAIGRKASVIRVAVTRQARKEIAEVATVYTRWIESVHVRGKDRNVFVTLAPRFKRLWTEAKKRFPNYVLKTPPTTQATPLKILAPVNGVDAFR